MPPSFTLVERASLSSSESTSSLSSGSYDCSGKDNGNSACQKPTNESALEIGLGVGIPVAIILVVLSYFLYKNYRSDKKESLERDPDFDENGDSTALPDFPAFSKEDPFAHRNSSHGVGHNGGYPMMHMSNKSGNDLRSMLTHGRDDGFIDGFVLPYQHQTDSKASLDEYAKQIMDQHSHRVNSMYSHGFGVQPGSTRVSPQKSTLRLADPVSRGPVGKLVSSDYTKLNNNSTSLVATDFYNTKEKLEESDGASGETTKTSGDHFDVEYENELNPVLNMSFDPHAKSPLRHVNGPDSDGVESVDTDDSDDEVANVASGSLDPSHADNTHDEIHDESHGDTQQTMPTFNVQSPFEDHHAFESQIEPTADEPAQVRPVVRTDGDFHFSNDLDDHKLASADNSFALADTSNMRKSPRMSAFNMLKNVSDDEGDEDVPIEDVKMTADQAEELARMKSVYKVYFDRANSVKSEHGGETGSHAFQADLSAPLPTLDVDRLKINDQLRGDTNYDKRKTTTSSIYEENPMYGESGNRTVIHPHQQFNAPPPNAFVSQQQYYGQQQYAPQNSYYTQQSPDPSVPPQDLPPLKSLPHPSDFRHSTIETFTDYQPRAKISSPSMKNQHNYFEPLADSNSSPYMSSQGSFASPTSPDMGELPPTLRYGNGISGQPSPSLLARTSVVMLNPVSEITTLRKFKPAGSLPSGVRQAPYYQSNDGLEHSNDDLIPGNRKSAVRRMMNTNF